MASEMGSGPMLAHRPFRYIPTLKSGFLLARARRSGRLLRRLLWRLLLRRWQRALTRRRGGAQLLRLLHGGGYALLENLAFELVAQ
jgi:hypothetical protein